MNEELKIIISAEIDQLKKHLDEAKGEIQDVGTKSNKFGEMAKKAGSVAATGFKVAAGAAVAVAGALVAVTESTKEYRTEQAKLQTAFESAGGSAENAKATYNDLYRVLGDSGQATEAAAHLAQLTTNEQELAQWTETCQGIYATFGDSLPIEGLTEAANETAKVGQVTGSLADALNWAGISEDEFNAKLEACNSEAEREALIRNTLNNVYKDAAAGYEENAKDILAENEAQAKLTATLAKLGEVVQPIITLFKSAFADALATVAPGLDMVAEGLNDILAGVDGGGAKLAEGINSMIEGLLGAITEKLPMLLNVGLQIIMGIIQGVAAALPNLVTTVIGFIPQLTEAVLGMLPTIVTLGVELIVALLQGIGETLPTVIEQIVAILPVIIDSLTEGIPLILEAAILMLMAIVEAIPQILPALIEALPQIINSIIDMVIDNIPMLLEASINLLFAIIDAIPIIIPQLIGALPDIIESIIRAVVKAIPMLLQAGIQLFTGLVTAVGKIIPNLLVAIGGIITTIKNELVEKAKKLFEFKWEFPKIKMPHFKVTGKFSLDPPQVPKLSIDWYAKGGVFENTTLFGYGNGAIGGLGENGAEAVVPLENNLGWLNKLADMLADRLDGGGAPIVLQVGEKVFGEVAVSSINKITKQTGALPLVIA